MNDFVGFSFDLVSHVLGENYKHLLCDIRLFELRGEMRTDVEVFENISRLRFVFSALISCRSFRGFESNHRISTKTNSLEFLICLSKIAHWLDTC